MSESQATVIRTPLEFFTELKKLSDAKVAAPPLTGSQLEAKIAELSLALESTTLTPELRKHIEAARADLIRQQYVMVHGFIPDENGARPVDENEIVKTVTASVLESLSAESLSSEIEPLDTEVNADVDLAEQEKAEVVSAESPVTITIPKELQAVTIAPDIVALLRAALRANLTHTVIKVLTILLQEK